MSQFFVARCERRTRRARRTVPPGQDRRRGPAPDMRGPSLPERRSVPRRAGFGPLRHFAIASRLTWWQTTNRLPTNTAAMRSVKRTTMKSAGSRSLSMRPSVAARQVSGRPMRRAKATLSSVTYATSRANSRSGVAARLDRRRTLRQQTRPPRVQRGRRRQRRQPRGLATCLT